MAIDFILVDRSQAAAIEAPLLLNYIATLRQAYELGAKTKAIMDHMQDGTTWTTLESKFGLAAGTGQTVYNYVNGSWGAMQNSFQNADCKNLPERVGG